MATRVSDWKPENDRVFSSFTHGQHLPPSHILLAAGPPSLSAIGGAAFLSGAASAGGSALDAIVYPIGMIQDLGLNQNQQVLRMMEIGSRRAYQVGGPTMGQISISRPLIHGPSLLRVLYAYYADALGPTIVPPMFANAGAALNPNPHDVKTSPGFENLFLNLDSDLFKQPVGMLMWVKDSNLDSYGAIYVENALIPSHNFMFSAQGVIVQESVALQYDQIVPVAVSALGLITGGASGLLT